MLTTEKRTEEFCLFNLASWVQSIQTPSETHLIDAMIQPQRWVVEEFLPKKIDSSVWFPQPSHPSLLHTPISLLYSHSPTTFKQVATPWKEIQCVLCMYVVPLKVYVYYTMNTPHFLLFTQMPFTSPSVVLDHKLSHRSQWVINKLSRV